MKLYIFDSGDWSVGIPSTTYEVDCPVENPDKETRELFREDMIKIYNEYSEGRVTAQYEDEKFND